MHSPITQCTFGFSIFHTLVLLAPPRPPRNSSNQTHTSYVLATRKAIKRDSLSADDVAPKGFQIVFKT